MSQLLGVRGGRSLVQWGAIAVLIVGIGLRFAHLDRAVYWYDETISSVRIAGYTKDEVEAIAPDQLRHPNDALVFQTPTVERGWTGTLASLAYENPEHSPLYFLLLRAWALVGGVAIAPLRALSALLSVAGLPLIYALARQLWTLAQGRSPATAALQTLPASTVGWLAVALLSLSPIEVVYARETRGYSLLLGLIVGTTWLLLRAIAATESAASPPGSLSPVAPAPNLPDPVRSPAPRSLAIPWFTYGLALTVGFYSHLSIALTVAAQGLYLGLRGGRTWSRATWGRSLGGYGLAGAGAVVAFGPWLYFLFTYRDKMGWVTRSPTLGTLLQRWLLNLNALVFDAQVWFDRPLFDITADQDPITLGVGAIAGLLLVPIAVALASVLMVRRLPRAVWALPVALSTTVLPYVLQDLLDGGQRSSIARYFWPAYLGLHLIVILGVAVGWTERRSRPWASLALIAMLLAGLISSGTAATASTWWNKYSSYDDRAIATLINPSDNPRVNPSNNPRVNPSNNPWDNGANPSPSEPWVISSSPLRVFSLARWLDESIALVIARTPAELPADLPTQLTHRAHTQPPSPIYLFRPNDEVFAAIAADPRYQLRVIDPFSHIWELVLAT